MIRVDTNEIPAVLVPLSRKSILLSHPSHLTVSGRLYVFWMNNVGRPRHLLANLTGTEDIFKPLSQVLGIGHSQKPQLCIDMRGQEREIASKKSRLHEHSSSSAGVSAQPRQPSVLVPNRPRPRGH